MLALGRGSEAPTPTSSTVLATRQPSSKDLKTSFSYNAYNLTHKKNDWARWPLFLTSQNLAQNCLRTPHVEHLNPEPYKCSGRTEQEWDAGATRIDTRFPCLDHNTR